MDKAHERTISEYRRADFNRRLHMYLQLPDQRLDFNAIEQSEQNHELSNGFRSKRKGSIALITVALASALGFAKKLLV